MAVTSIYRPPQAVESERALLGALLLDSQIAWPQVADLIKPEHFFRADHRLIFDAISYLMRMRRGADAVVVIDYLGEQLEAAGGANYIAELVDDVGSASNAGEYARQIREAADKTAAYALSQHIASKVREGDATAENVIAFALEEYQRLAGTAPGRRHKPLQIEPMAAWATEPAPPPRDWVVEGLIPAGRVTLLTGNGGLGKTLLAMQMAMHVALSRMLFGVRVHGGPVVGIFCEDEQDELKRRGRAAALGERIDLSDIEGCYPLSREGMDNALCTFVDDRIKLEDFYFELEETIKELCPRVVILDTAADIFIGDFISTPHVRQFIKVALGGLCKRHGCAIVLLAHPSQSAMNSGDGGGFSVAWNNSVRSRLYFRMPRTKDLERAKDRRVLEVRKSNYGPTDTSIPLIWQDGYFVPDVEPIDETEEAITTAGPRGAPNKMAFAALNYIRSKSPAAVAFGDLYDFMQKRREFPAGAQTEAARKQLQRALRHLKDNAQIRDAVGRGNYRLAEEDPPK